MQESNNLRKRLIQISKLRKNQNDDEAVRFLVNNTSGDYGILLALDLVNITKLSQDILLFYEKLIENNKIINYSKKEIVHWVSKISPNIKSINLEDLNTIVVLINGNFSKKPLLGREIVLETLRGLIPSSNFEKIQIINTKVKKNLVDYRHKYLLTKYFKDKNYLILAFETLEKYVDNLRIILLKNEILIEISNYIFEKRGESLNLISKGSGYNEFELEKRLVNIMNEYSEIFNIEYQKIKEIHGNEKINLKTIIHSMTSRNDFLIQDMFISSDVESFNISKQLIECKMISIDGIIDKAKKREVEYLELCNILPEILEISNNTRNNIILHNFLLERNMIPVKISKQIIKYVHKNIDKLENLVILRTAKLCESISDINLGIKLLENLNTESSVKLLNEFKNKIDWLENGYDLERIVDEYKINNYVKKKDKILYFVHSDLPYVTSGYTIRTGAVTRNLSDNDFDIEIVTRWGFPLDRINFVKDRKLSNKIIDGHGIIHNFLPSDKGMREFSHYEYIKEGVKNLLSQCQEIRPALIIGVSDHVSGLIGLVTSRILKIPFIYEMRGLWAYTRATNNIGYENTFDFNLRMKLEEQCALEATRVITISDKLREIVVKWGVDKKRIDILPNCIEDNEEPIELININPENVKLGYIGSLVPYEGLITTIKSIHAIKNTKKIIPKLIIAGDGTERKRLEDYVKNNKLNEHVEFRGRIEHTEIERFYEEVDAIILPRLSTLVTDIIPPLKPLEAISKRKIVLFSDIFPHRELFDGIETTFVFKQGNINSQVDVIEKFINFSGDFNRIVNDSLKIVLNNRNYQKIMLPIKKEINKIIN